MRKRFAGIALVFIAFLTAVPIESTTAASELKVVWEKSFPWPIVDAVFGEEEITVKEAKARGWKDFEGKKDTDKVKVPYPKAVFIPEDIYINDHPIKEIKFLDKNQKVLKTIPVRRDKLERVFRSPQGKYIIVGKNPDEDHPDLEGGTLYDYSGNVIWTKTDVNYPIAVSDDGYVISGGDWETYAPPAFYIFDKSGKQVGKIDNPLLAESDSGFGGARFVAGSRNILVGFSNYRRSCIILATREGKIIWQKDLLYACKISSESDIIKDVGLVGIGDIYEPTFETKIFFIDWDGNFSWIVPLEIRGNIIVNISYDRKAIFVTSTEGYLWCIDLKSGRFLWKHKEKWAPIQGQKYPDNVPNFYEMQVEEKYIYIMGKYTDNNRGWYASTLFVFNALTGKLINETNFMNSLVSLLPTIKQYIIITDINTKKIKFVELSIPK